MPHGNTAAVRAAFSVVAGLAEFAVVIWSAIGVETLYHSQVYGWNGLSSPNLQLCFFVAALFVVSNAMRNEYAIANYLELQGASCKIISNIGAPRGNINRM